MRIGLSVWGWSRLIAFGLACLLVAVGTAARAVRHSLFYSQIEARVDDLGAGCSIRGLTEARRAVIAAHPRAANEQWVDCAAVADLVANMGDEVRVRRRQQAHIRYVSPADGQEHEAVPAPASPRRSTPIIESAIASGYERDILVS
jgi:hypothetical protein